MLTHPGPYHSENAGLATELLGPFIMVALTTIHKHNIQNFLLNKARPSNFKKLTPCKMFSTYSLHIHVQNKSFADTIIRHALTALK